MIESPFTDYYDEYFPKEILFIRNPILENWYEKLMFLQLFSKPTPTFGHANELRSLELSLKINRPISVFDEEWNEQTLSAREIRRNDIRFGMIRIPGKQREVYYVGSKMISVYEKGAIIKPRGNDFLPFPLCKITQIADGRNVYYVDVEVNCRLPVFKKVKQKQIAGFLAEFIMDQGDCNEKN